MAALKVKGLGYDADGQNPRFTSDARDPVISADGKELAFIRDERGRGRLMVRGLARREPSLRDRRSKNIVLTPEGVTVRDRLFREILSQAPWCTELDTGERRCLLGLMRKMLRARSGR